MAGNDGFFPDGTTSAPFGIHLQDVADPPLCRTIGNETLCY